MKYDVVIQSPSNFQKKLENALFVRTHHNREICDKNCDITTRAKTLS